MKRTIIIRKRSKFPPGEGVKLGVDSEELRYVPEAERVIADNKGPIASGVSVLRYILR